MIDNVGITPGPMGLGFIHHELVVDINRELYFKNVHKFIWHLKRIAMVLATTEDLNNFDETKTVGFNLRFKDSLFSVDMGPDRITAFPMTNPRREDTLVLYNLINKFFKGNKGAKA
jgi:hypothetical protein